MSPRCKVCSDGAKLQCPTCKKLKLPPAYFCSNECFKKAWNEHKSVHVIAKKPQKKRVWYPEMFDDYAFTGPLRPGIVTPFTRTVPKHIPRPDYADDPEGDSKSERAIKRTGLAIFTHTAAEIEILRQVGKLGAEVMAIAGKFAKPGVTTDEIDRIVHEAIVERNSYPSTLNYKLFPKSLCTSVNEVICHGIPDDRELLNGDILNCDICLYYKGYHTDLNETWLIGDAVSAKHKKLVRVAYECLNKAIAFCGPGRLYRDIGNIISKHAHKNRFSVVKTLCGHGVGKLFHCDPDVPHYAKNKTPGIMRPGHCFTIEPMINEGDWRDKMWPDRWTIATEDGKRSAQFEHTILITKEGHEVLTKRTQGTYTQRF